MCEHNSAGVIGNTFECLAGNEKYLIVRTESGNCLQEVYFGMLLYCQEEMTLLSFFFKKGCVLGVITWVET